MSDHCDEALANLYAFLDDEMEDARVTSRIQQHLTDCPPCGGAFHFERRLKVVVRERLHEEVPVRVLERLRVVIRSAGVD